LYDFGKREFKPEGLMEAVRKDNWKAIRPLTNAPIELYNLSHDISEEHNVADQWPNIIGQMNSLLRQARTAGHPQIEPKIPEGKRYR
jgi:arylsulfatase A-like enzyme